MGHFDFCIYCHSDASNLIKTRDHWTRFLVQQVFSQGVSSHTIFQIQRSFESILKPWNIIFRQSLFTQILAKGRFRHNSPTTNRLRSDSMPTNRRRVKRRVGASTGTSTSPTGRATAASRSSTLRRRRAAADIWPTSPSSSACVTPATSCSATISTATRKTSAWSLSSAAAARPSHSSSQWSSSSVRATRATGFESTPTFASTSS